MRKIILLVCVLAIFTLTSCGFIEDLLGNNNDTNNEKVAITEFEIPGDDVVDIGTLYTLSKVSCRDDKGGYYMSVPSVIDPDGQEVEINKFTFLCSKFGEYVVTYTVTYNGTDTLSRSFKILVMDVTAPQVKTDLYEHNIGTIGQTVSLDQFVVTDNSGEDITHTTKVYFNGELDESSIENNVLTLTKEGCYTIELTAKDSNNNEMISEYNVYTLMDFEAGYYFNNPSYASEITKKHAYDGEASYSIGLFDNHYTWFNDLSMLGCVQILDSSMTYVSFWIKFANPDYADILKARYYEVVIYDEFGDELPKYGSPEVIASGDYGYELFGDRWYKVVVELGNVVNKGEVYDAPGEIIANPKSLDLIPFYWGVWDSINGTNASKVQKVFIDNVMLTNDPTSGYKDAVGSDYEYPVNCVADFESNDQLDAFVGSWNSQLSLDSTIVASGNKSLKLVPYVQWSDFAIKGTLGVDDLSSYSTLTSKIYLEDTSSTNNYSPESNTYVVFELRYSTVVVDKIVIDDVSKLGTWLDVEFALGAYNQFALSSRNFDFCVYKLVDGVAIDTGAYENFAIYLDDIYVK